VLCGAHSCADENKRYCQRVTCYQATIVKYVAWKTLFPVVFCFLCPSSTQLLVLGVDMCYSMHFHKISISQHTDKCATNSINNCFPTCVS
jgi:hypothetical protein